MRRYMDEMKVDLPEGEHGECKITHFEVVENDLRNLSYALSGRGCRPGWYTRMDRGSTLWMSDTDAERSDHLEAAWEIGRHGGRVLIGGLGLGCILRVALLTPHVEHVDVVELNEDVIALVGPTYMTMAKEAGIELVIHNEDLLEKKWPRGTRWNTVWLDIWPTICEDNLDEMAKLRRSYGQRSDWNECWSRDILVRERERTRNEWWR